MNQIAALNLVKDLKSELVIPSETCPLIDAVIRRMKAAIKYAEDYSQEAVDELTDAMELMETIRADNSQLRDLGKEWYAMASDLAHQFSAREGRTK